MTDLSNLITTRALCSRPVVFHMEKCSVEQHVKPVIWQGLLIQFLQSASHGLHKLKSKRWEITAANVDYSTCKATSVRCRYMTGKSTCEGSCFLKCAVHLLLSGASAKAKFLNFQELQVSTLYNGCKQGIYRQIFIRKSISRRITHPQSVSK